MRRKWVIAGALALASAFVCGPTALAASPVQIYRDYADNGQLDGHYSAADLQRALKSASIQGYGKPTTTVRFKPATQQQLGAQARRSGGLPFTGLDLSLLTIGGVSLLAIGAGVRRISRAET